MQLKTARRGRNAGSQFWSCTGYATKQCDGTIDYAAPMAEVDPVPSGSQLIAETMAEPRAVMAQPLHEGLDTVYFEFLTVPADDLEIIGDCSSSEPIGQFWAF